MREQQEELTRIIAGELRAQKARLNVTNEDIARKADVTSMTISRYLTGERKVPVDVFWAICEALQIDGGALLDSAAERVRKQEQEKKNEELEFAHKLFGQKPAPSAQATPQFPSDWAQLAADRDANKRAESETPEE